MSFKLYDSAGFTVTDLGYGVLVRANVAAVETFLQGDDANETIEGLMKLDETWSDNHAKREQFSDAYLSELFTNDAPTTDELSGLIDGDPWHQSHRAVTNHGDDARRLIGERE